MNSDPIQDLLHSADVPPRGAVDPQALAVKVLRISQRRRKLRNAGIVALMILLIVPITVLVQHHSTVQVAQRPPSPALQGRGAALLELQSLNSQIAVEERIVRAMTLAEKNARLSSRMGYVESQPDENQVVERAASIVVFQTDRAFRETSDPVPALRAYREVLANFPQAISADVARQRIAQLQKAG